VPDLKERYSCSGPEAIERICGPSCLMPRRGGEGRASFNLGSITGEFKIQGCNNHLGGSNKKTWKHVFSVISDSSHVVLYMIVIESLYGR